MGKFSIFCETLIIPGDPIFVNFLELPINELKNQTKNKCCQTFKEGNEAETWR